MTECCHVVHVFSVYGFVVYGKIFCSIFLFLVFSDESLVDDSKMACYDEKFLFVSINYCFLLSFFTLHDFFLLLVSSYEKKNR